MEGCRSVIVRGEEKISTPPDAELVNRLLNDVLYCVGN